jgi:uncharacterized Zn-finger protein
VQDLQTSLFSLDGAETSHPFQCQLCSSSFLQLPHLKKHMRCINKKDRPYVCLPCNAFFHMKNELTQHTASHPSPPASEKSGDDSAESAAGSQSAETKPPVVEARIMRECGLRRPMPYKIFGKFPLTRV